MKSIAFVNYHRRGGTKQENTRLYIRWINSEFHWFVNNSFNPLQRKKILSNLWKTFKYSISVVAVGYSLKCVSFLKTEGSSNSCSSFLFQPLARLGASILGIDAVSENISTAEYHAEPSLKANLRYKHGRSLFFVLPFIEFVSLV